MMQGFPFFPCYKDGYSTKKWSGPSETLEEIKAFAQFYHEYVHTMKCPSATADVIEDMHGSDSECGVGNTYTQATNAEAKACRGTTTCPRCTEI